MVVTVALHAQSGAVNHDAEDRPWRLGYNLLTVTWARTLVQCGSVGMPLLCCVLMKVVKAWLASPDASTIISMNRSPLS